MTWISYAQNAEDVRLRRAFLGQPGGLYIDVGANDPVDCSITKHFYDSGWSGINVEPAPRPFASIARARKRDTNLNVACSNRTGSMTLYAARVTALSTLTEEEVVVHRQRGLKFDTMSVPVVTLSSVCAEHVKDRQVDFLSVDVEGHEREVLEGADFRRFRPRVIVVEATRPNTTEPTHDRWEHLILDHDYCFAVFDGLNRYYVRREDERLVPIISLAPNSFDQFIPYVYQRQIEDLQVRYWPRRIATTVTRSIDRVTRAIGRTARSIASAK